jgi:hypothetical protein
MQLYSEATVERAMKVQEVILRPAAGKITWIQAAEILGVTPRHMRRWKEKYEQFGFHALFDGRRGRTSPAVSLRLCSKKSCGFIASNTLI